MARNLPAPIIKIVGFLSDATAMVEVTMPPGTDPDIDIKVLRRIELNENSRPLKLEGSPFSSHEIEIEDTATRDHPGKVVTYLARAVRGGDDSPLTKASAKIPSLRLFKRLAVISLVFAVASILVSAHLQSQLVKTRKELASQDQKFAVQDSEIRKIKETLSAKSVAPITPPAALPATSPATRAAVVTPPRLPATFSVGADPGPATKAVEATTLPTTTVSPTTKPASRPIVLRSQNFVIKPDKGREEVMRYIYSKLPGDGPEDKPTCIAVPATTLDRKENPITLILEDSKAVKLEDLYEPAVDRRGYRWIVAPHGSKLKATFFDVRGNLKIVSAPLAISYVLSR